MKCWAENQSKRDAGPLRHPEGHCRNRHYTGRAEQVGGSERSDECSDPDLGLPLPTWSRPASLLPACMPVLLNTSGFTDLTGFSTGAGPIFLGRGCGAREPWSWVGKGRKRIPITGDDEAGLLFLFLIKSVS